MHCLCLQQSILGHNLSCELCRSSSGGEVCPAGKLGIDSSAGKGKNAPKGATTKPSSTTVDSDDVS